jgi:hypothetical protein
MRWRRSEPEPAPQPPEDEPLRDEFGGSDDCPHIWLESLKGPLYRGPRDLYSPYTLGERCLMCGRVWVFALVYKETLA